MRRRRRLGYFIYLLCLRNLKEKWEKDDEGETVAAGWSSPKNERERVMCFCFVYVFVSFKLTAPWGDQKGDKNK